MSVSLFVCLLAQGKRKGGERRRERSREELICLFVCLAVCLFAWLVVCLFVCLGRELPGSRNLVKRSPCSRNAPLV